jgi:NCAIR mutase (PurE)-related protein
MAMTPKKITELLNNIREGRTSVEEGVKALSALPFKDIGVATVDHHRQLRCGFPEVVLGQGKSAEQIVAIVKEMKRSGSNVLVTRVRADKAEAVREQLPELTHEQEARCLVLEQEPPTPQKDRPVFVVSAGTSDIPVAEEACLVAELAGCDVRRIFDVGVAGIHRLFHRLDELRQAAVIVVVAGMEGALASVVGGLVSCPVIAVPTSIGYGASFQGVAALLGMLNSCAAGVTVVNIDNGFGAGYSAALMSRIGKGHHG